MHVAFGRLRRKSRIIADYRGLSRIRKTTGFARLLSEAGLAGFSDLQECCLNARRIWANTPQIADYRGLGRQTV